MNKLINPSLITIVFSAIMLPVLLYAPLTAYADTGAAGMPAMELASVEIANAVVMEPAEMGAEETLCPEIPICPDDAGSAVPVCPLEGAMPEDFGSLSVDAEGYMDFLRKEVYYYLDDSSGSKVIKRLGSELDWFFFTYRDVPVSAEALYLKSRLYSQWREYELQLAALLKIIYEYPGGAFYNKAMDDATDLMRKKLKKDARDNLDLLKPAHGPLRPDNKASMIEAFIRLGNSKYLEVQLAELDEFLAYYPRHPKSDLMMTFRANNFIRQKNYEAAAHSLRRMVSFYRQSELRPASLYMLGLLYADELKEYEKAVGVFEEIIDSYPASSQAVTSHERAADLYHKKLKLPFKAVVMLEDLVSRYPEEDVAMRAFTYIASIHESQKMYNKALDAFMRQADMFRMQPDRAVSALFEAARVSEKRLRDNRLAVEMLLEIYTRYPGHKQTPEALYEVAGMYENDLKEMEPAKEYYKRVADEYPSHKLSRTAARRLESILNRQMKEELKRQEKERKAGAETGGRR